MQTKKTSTENSTRQSGSSSATCSAEPSWPAFVARMKIEAPELRPDENDELPAKPKLQFEVVRLSEKTLDALKNWMHQMSAVAQELCEDKGMVSSAQCIARDAAALNEALMDELATENQEPKSPNEPS